MSLLKRVFKITILTVTTATLVTHSALAMDVDFFSNNDILFYDPDGCVITNQNGDIALQGNDNAEKIFRFLTSTKFSGFNNQSFNAIQAAGALGNFQQESTMDPSSVEQPSGEGHGLAQWSYDRRETLYKLADSMGKRWDNLDVQVKMIDNELNGSYGQSLISADFNNVKTPQEAAYIFQKVYEGAGNPQQSRRDNAAATYYKEFSNISPAGTDAAAGVDSNTSSDSCQTSSSTYVADDGFTVYNQYDPKWANNSYGTSTISASGCGPSAMAAIITALTGKTVTPDQTASYGGSHGTYIPGTGSSWNIAPILAEHWGLKAEHVNMNVADMNTALNAGKLLIISGQGSTPFTSAGHYITIRGVTSDGKWKIADSNGTRGAQNSKQAWEPQTILVNANEGSLYAISK